MRDEVVKERDKQIEEAKRECDKTDAIIEMMREQVRIMREGQRVS